MSRLFPQDETIPVSIRIPGPLRALLKTGTSGLGAAANRAWNTAQEAQGAWCEASQRDLLGASPHAFLQAIRLRAVGHRLDVQLDYIKGLRALAIGRRLIVSFPSIPITPVASAEGGPLATLIEAPFLDSAAIIIQREISREGSPRMDVRCRCPAHLVVLIA